MASLVFPGRVREDLTEWSPASLVREGKWRKGHKCRKQFVQSSDETEYGKGLEMYTTRDALRQAK